MTHGPLSWRELVERDKQKSEDARGQIKRAAMQPTPRPQEAVMQSERTTFEALNSALRFAASRSAITSAEELAIMAAWNARASDAVITRLTEALRAAEEREKALREALVQHNDRLRSAAAVAARDGRETNWLSFRGQVRYTLTEYHELVKESRAELERIADE